MQPDNSGQLSLLLIENLKKLRHDIIPEHFDETDFSYDTSNKTEIKLALLGNLKSNIKPSKSYLKNKKLNKREKERKRDARL